MRNFEYRSFAIHHSIFEILYSIFLLKKKKVFLSWYAINPKTFAQLLKKQVEQYIKFANLDIQVGGNW
jgi:hypothetical protein